MKPQVAAWAVSAVLCVATLAAAWCAHAQDAYWDRRAEGWFWYRDPSVEESSERAERAPIPEGAPASELERHDRLRRRLRELRAIAIMSPTPANVERYMREQRLALDLSATFADQWRRIVWTTPGLDYSLQHRPTNALAGAIHDEQARRERGRRLADLARTQGVALFFAADCPQCAEMGRTLALLKAKHGLHAMGISVDGSDMPHLDDVRADNGISARLGVANFPSMFLFEPGTQAAQPIGSGLLSLGEIEERIDVLAHFPLGSRF